MTTQPNTLAQQLAHNRAAQEAGQTVQRSSGKPANVMDLLKDPRLMQSMSSVLSSEEMAKRFLRISLTECQRQPDLFTCIPETFAGALLLCAQLNLEPGPAMGVSWLLPFKDKKRGGKKVCTFVLGYPGVIQLGMRSGRVRRIAGIPVHTGDEFDYEPSMSRPRHRRLDIEAARQGEILDRGKAYCYYFLLEYANGGVTHDVMTRPEVERHRRRFSKSPDSGPWVDHFDRMACKTVILRGKRVVPLSAEWVLGTTADEGAAVWEPGVQGITAENLLELGEREEGDGEPAADEGAPKEPAPSTTDAAAGQMKLGEGGEGSGR